MAEIKYEDLLKNFGYVKLNDVSLIEVFRKLKKEPDINKFQTNYRSLIKTKIIENLDIINYWDFIPVP